MKIEYRRDYAQARSSEYPRLEDQIDTIWKALAALKAKGTKLDPDADAMLRKITDVKAKYPKPSNT